MGTETIEQMQERLLRLRESSGSQNQTVAPTKLTTSINSILSREKERMEQYEAEKKAAPLCEKHGCSTHGGCPECYVEMQEEEMRAKSLAREEREAARLKMLRDHPEDIMKECGVPARFIREGYTLEKFKLSKQKTSFLESWARNPSDSLFIFGTTGTGKTTLAAALIREMIAYQMKPKFMFVPDVIERIKHSFDGGGYFELEEQFGYKQSAPVVVMDDFGAFKASEWSVSVMEQIIDMRYRDMLPMIVTSNLSLEEIEKTMSARIASRLNTFKALSLSGSDFRKASK